MKRTISFGKHAVNNNRKENLITIELEVRTKDRAINYDTLEEVTNVPEISICGTAWNRLHTDCIMGGQCIDLLVKIVKTKRIRRIEEIWNKYHLNDMKAGTKLQTEAIEHWREQNKYDYTQACEYLKSIGLYEDRGYKYGHGWLYMPIPENILEELKTI